MEELLASIKNLLNRHIGLHRQLLELVRLENEAITQINLKELQEITFSKEALIHAIQSCETQRKEVSKKMGISNIDQVIDALEASKRGDEAGQLRTIVSTLKLLVERISDQNNQNSQLVEASLLHVQTMKKNLLGLSETHTNTYTALGQSQAPGEQRPRLIEKEA